MENAIGTQHACAWTKRKEIIFKNNKIYTDLSELIKKAHGNELSIAAFKPSEVMDFKVEEVKRNWDPQKIKDLEAKAQQGDFFKTKEEVRERF